MTRPIIGITPRLNDQGVQLTLNLSYLVPFNQRGCSEIILPLDSPNLEDILNLCTGFVISGGSDIDPAFYGETNSGLSKNIQPSLDLIDRLTIEHAIKNAKPLLGICRGEQAIAAFLGGSLHQDLVSCGVTHFEDENHLHEVIKVTQTTLTNLLPERFSTNSYHHQAVNQIPHDFIVTYRSLETIEAFEHCSLPIIAFQWHPERMDTAESKIIFDYFVGLLNEYEQKRN